MKTYPGTIFDVDLDKIREECIADIIKSGICVPLDKIDPDIYVNIHSKDYYAITEKLDHESFRFRIGFSNRCFEDFKMDLDAYRNIMMHEFLHTIPGCYSHGKRWKSYVHLMNTKYDYKINPKPYGKDTFKTCGLY